jgi:hypothetical protein
MSLSVESWKVERFGKLRKMEISGIYARISSFQIWKSCEFWNSGIPRIFAAKVAEIWKYSRNRRVQQRASQ